MFKEFENCKLFFLQFLLLVCLFFFTNTCLYLQIQLFIINTFFFFEFKFENCIFDQFVCYILGNANLWFCTPTLPYYNINREKCQPAMSFYNIVQLRSLPVSCKLILLALTVLNCLMYTFSSEIHFFVTSR